MNNWPIKQNQKQEQQKDDYFSSEIQNSRSLVTYFTICFRFKQTDNFFSCQRIIHVQKKKWNFQVNLAQKVWHIIFIVIQLERALDERKRGFDLGWQYCSSHTISVKLL